MIVSDKNLWQNVAFGTCPHFNGQFHVGIDEQFLLFNTLGIENAGSHITSRVAFDAIHLNFFVHLDPSVR